MRRPIYYIVLLFFVSAPTLVEAQTSAPRIVSRAEWGADESFGVMEQNVGTTNGGRTARELTRASKTRTLTDKEKKCRDIARFHPEDFRTSHTVTENERGEKLAWAKRYSNSVKLIVIHHTGEHRNSEAEKLQGVERVRAIYKGHAVGNGWGDIGYHYIIDKKGVIYEGRAGGKNVVGAHSYCGNVNTVSIAMTGNFQIEYPTEAQLRSVRRMIAYLADEYGLDPNGRSMFQGRSLPTVVAHRALAPTQCAGRKTQKLLPRIRRLAAAGDFETAMLIGEQRVARRTTPVTRVTQSGVRAKGSTLLRMPPRGVSTIQLAYRANSESIATGKSIAEVKKSDSGIGLWQQRRGNKVRVRRDIRADQTIHSGQEIPVTLTVLAPRNTGRYSVNVGGVSYTIEVEGRRMR